MNKVAIRLIVAVALLAVAVVTFEALRESDRWRRPGRNTSRHVNDPFDGLARLLAADPTPPATPARDPFRPGDIRPASPHTATVKVLQPLPPPRELPVLTAIVFDAVDPRAVIRYEGRNYTVRAGDLFADYEVVSITSDTVVLLRAGEQLVLKNPPK